MRKQVIRAAFGLGGAGLLALVTAGPAMASTTFAGVPSSRTLVSERGVPLHTGDSVTTGGKTYAVTTVQSAGGAVTFGVNPALPAADVHKSVPFTKN